MGAESVISCISPMLASMLAGTDARINTIQAHVTLEAALHDALDSVGQAHKGQP